MGYNSVVNDAAVGNGGAGNPGVWDIITGDRYDLEGQKVCAFMSLDSSGGTFEEIREEVFPAKKGDPGRSQDVEARYLTYTYPQYVIFEGRYTSLVPAVGSTFKVWFLR